MSHVKRPPHSLAAPLAASSVPPHRLQAQLRRTLWGLTALVALLLLAGTGLFLWGLREERLADAEIRAKAGARLLEEHVLRTFRATEFVLDRLVAIGRSAPMAQLGRSRAAWREMAALTHGLPEPGTLWIADAEGRVVLGSLGFPATPTSIADRGYFQAHKEARRDVAIGPLVAVKNRIGHAFHLSKRIEDADGELIGVAAAGIEAPYFTDFYRNLSLGPASNLSIFDGDGRVVLRQPDPERWVDGSVAGGPVFQSLAQAPRGVVMATSPLDGILRVVAYRRVEPYGMVVICGVAIDDALTQWRRTAAMTLGAVAVLAAVLGTLAALAFRGLAREAGLTAGLEHTIRQRTEEARIQAEEARRANETKTRFLAAASHDLRQPLQAAGMFVEALAARMTDSPDLPIVDKLRQSVEATQALLATLLDASTLEAGRVEAHPTPFPLAPMLANLIDQMEPEAAAAGLGLRVVPTDSWVVSDPVLLERMLRNLVVNALRYTARGGVVLGCRRRGAELAIQVVDTGCGIPAEQLSTIFEDFTRLGDKRPGTARGLGLGLSVVRRMAALMDHRIEVRSVAGRGSTFSVVVPRAQPRLVSSGVAPGSASDRVSAAKVQPSTAP